MSKIMSCIALIMVLLFLSNIQASDEHGKRRGSQLFYRMSGSQNNAPILPKTRSVWTQDKRCEVGNTGMANEGYTEYPFCFGLMDFSFVERYSIYPRCISGAVGSTPSFTRSGSCLFADLFSFSVNSSRDTMSTVPRSITLICSSTLFIPCLSCFVPPAPCHLLYVIQRPVVEGYGKDGS